MRAVIAGMLLLVGLAACGSGDDADVERTTPVEEPSEVVEDETADDPPATEPPPTEPPPTDTREPTPTETAAPTATDEPTATEVPPTDVPEDAAAAPEAPAEPPAPVAPGNAQLAVTFTKPHYECVMECVETGYGHEWSYRHFQLLMTVTNNSSDLTVTGGGDPTQGWRPTAWYITDGTNTWVDEYSWQWLYVGSDFMERPDIGPGATAEWTWLVQPVPYGQWVIGVEYTDPWGNTYGQGFEKPVEGQMGFRDCGFPQEKSCG